MYEVSAILPTNLRFSFDSLELMKSKISKNHLKRIRHYQGTSHKLLFIFEDETWVEHVDPFENVLSYSFSY